VTGMTRPRVKKKNITRTKYRVRNYPERGGDTNWQSAP